MQYARIQDGVVAELFTPPTNVSIGQCFHPDLVWVEVPAGVVVVPGWTYAEGVFSPPKNAT